MQRIPFDGSGRLNKKHCWDQVTTEFEGACAYCGRQTLQMTLDHVLPESKGGRDSPANLVPACNRCNQEKGSQPLDEWYTSRLAFYCPQRLAKIQRRRKSL